jgi:hypothetical protein
MNSASVGALERLNEERTVPASLRTDGEIAEYDLGFQAGKDGKEAENTKSYAWQCGWAKARNKAVFGPSRLHLM